MLAVPKQTNLPQANMEPEMEPCKDYCPVKGVLYGVAY